MSVNFQYDRQQAHILLDRLPPAKLGAIRNLLEVMIDEDDDGDDDQLTEQNRVAIQAGRTSLDTKGGVPMEEVLADFGLTMADFEKMTAEPDSERAIT